MKAYVFTDSGSNEAYYKAEEVDAKLSDLHGTIKSLNLRCDDLLASADVVAEQRDALREIVEQYQTNCSQCNQRYCLLCIKAQKILASLRTEQK